MFAVTAYVNWSVLLTPELIRAAIRIALLLGIGLPLVVFASSMAGRAVKKRLTPQAQMIVRKGILYGGVAAIVIMVLYEANFKLTALLGAAGIAGIAIGFASQTSVSNIISGLFLISEKPFAVGDIIELGETRGTVLSIDLLSVKLQTFDNRFVRIPNESIIKTQLINMTRFPIRRLDINIGVAYKEDVGKVRDALLDIADKNPLCLNEPEPFVRFVNFGDSALEFLFGIWCVRQDFIALRTQVMREIKERFDAEGIEIPFPHRTLYTGSVTDPLPIRLVDAPSGHAASNPLEKTLSGPEGA